MPTTKPLSRRRSRSSEGGAPGCSGHCHAAANSSASSGSISSGRSKVGADSTVRTNRRAMKSASSAPRSVWLDALRRSLIWPPANCANPSLAPPDRDGHDSAPVDVEPSTCGCGPRSRTWPSVFRIWVSPPVAQVHTANGSVVRGAEEQDPAVGVGERHRRLRDARMRNALLELDVETLTRELRRKLHRGERGSGSALTGRMEQGI